jgi:hypothetical protein
MDELVLLAARSGEYAAAIDLCLRLPGADMNDRVGKLFQALRACGLRAF